MKSSQSLRSLTLVVLLALATSCATDRAAVPSPQPVVAKEAAKVSVIDKITYTEEEKYTRIRIVGSEPMAPPFYKLQPDPLRIVIDLPNVDLRPVKGPVRVDNGTVGEIVVTQYDDKGKVEIGLAQMANYLISKEGKDLLIDIEKVKRVAEVKEAPKAEEPPKEKGPEAPAPEPKKEEILPPQPVVTSPPPPAPLNKAKEILTASVDPGSDFVTYTLVTDGKVESYNSFKLDAPSRLVLDVWNVGSRVQQKSIKTSNAFIKDVRIGRYPDKVRLVFDSAAPQLPPYQVQQSGEKLLVLVGNVPPAAASAAGKEEKTGDASAKASAPEPPAKNPKPSTLQEIDFKQMDGVSRVTVTLSGEPSHQAYLSGKNAIVVDVKNAFAPKHLQRRLDTSAFESSVNDVSIQNVKVGKVSDLRVLIKLREEAPFVTAVEGNKLFVDIEGPRKPAVKAEAPAAPAQEPPKVEKAAPPAEEKPVPEPPIAKKAEEEKPAAGEGVGEKVYVGRKLSLDFKDADIKNILRLIAEVSNLNVIAGDDVTGKVTMRLVDVPWDHALDIILQSRTLGMSRVGNVVRVAPLDVLKKEVQNEMEAKRAKDRLEDLVTELIAVNYATAKEILPQVKSVLSDRGDVKVDDRTNYLIVKDIPRNIPGVKSLVRSLDTKTPQVLIEARIIEANLTFQQELGVSWGFLMSTGEGQNKTFKSGGGVPGSTLGSTANQVVQLPAVPVTGTPGLIEFLFTSAYGLKELDVAISAHEGKGDVRIVSSPKIATLDNKQASIEQGLRIPYLKLTTEGTVTTDFIEANLKLTVIPHVTNDGNVKMLINVRKDAPDYTVTVQGVPRIDKKEAISEVLVKDNGVVVIAGVYTIEKDSNSDGIPLFNKIPLFGWLFKREAKVDQRKDLLIFISPKILRDQI